MLTGGARAAVRQHWRTFARGCWRLAYRAVDLLAVADFLEIMLRESLRALSILSERQTA
jgi:hypothetical protein